MGWAVGRRIVHVLTLIRRPVCKQYWRQSEYNIMRNVMPQTRRRESISVDKTHPVGRRQGDASRALYSNRSINRCIKAPARLPGAAAPQRHAPMTARSRSERSERTGASCYDANPTRAHGTPPRAKPISPTCNRWSRQEHPSPPLPPQFRTDDGVQPRCDACRPSAVGTSGCAGQSSRGPPTREPRGVISPHR